MKKRQLFALLLLLAGWAGADADTTETYDFSTWAQSYCSATNDVLALSVFAGSSTVSIGSNSYTGTVAATDNNYLAGAYTDYTIAAGNYILQSQATGTAFFKTKADREATSNRAFLDGSKFDNTNAKPLVVSGLTTSIDNGRSEAATNNVYYSISGQRLQRPVKGLNIVNGKKFVLK